MSAGTRGHGCCVRRCGRVSVAAREADGRWCLARWCVPTIGAAGDNHAGPKRSLPGENISMLDLVVIGYDGSPESGRAIVFAAAALDAEQAVVVNVWHHSTVLAGPVPVGRRDGGSRRGARAHRLRCSRVKAQPGRGRLGCRRSPRFSLQRQWHNPRAHAPALGRAGSCACSVSSMGPTRSGRSARADPTDASACQCRTSSDSTRASQWARS